MTDTLPQDLNTLYDQVQAEYSALLIALRANPDTFQEQLLKFRADFDRCYDAPSQLAVLARWRAQLGVSH